MLKNKKIKTIEQLSNLLKTLRRAGEKVVYCHGVFDLLHIGHIRYLQQARSMGDYLVVTLTPDKYVDKGYHRPAFNEVLRAEAVASLDSVNFVAINKWPTAEETLRVLRPDVYVKGSDFKNAESDMTGKLLMEEQIVKEIGAELAFTTDIVFSSTKLINRFFSNFPEEIQQYMKLFRSRYKLNDILDLLDKMASISVLVVGDTILDDYHFCHSIGSSSKDPVIAVQYDTHDIFLGGVLAVANHVANFASSVRLGTILGEEDNQDGFIRAKLRENISPYFAVQNSAPTLIKRRFVDGYTLNKLFEIYIMNDSGLSEEKDNQFCEWLKEELKKYDMVIAADFGHGAISQKLRQILIECSPFLAINTQANSGNRGYHTVSRYSHADYISLAEPEIRLEMRDPVGEIRPMMEKLTEKFDCRAFAVTCGKKGAMIQGKNEFVKVPAFAQKAVDRIGAGDAFFSITALAAYLDAPLEIIGFIGNIAGGLAVEIVGNQKAVDKMSVKKYITSLLK